MPKKAAKKKVTDMERRLVFAYLEHMNYRKAALAAGYKVGSRGGGPTAHQGASSYAWKHLNKPHVAEFLNEQLEMLAMSAKEVIYRTDLIARGDMGDYLDDNGYVDIVQVKEDNLTGIIKKYRTRTKDGPLGKDGDPLWSVTDVELELYPADAALERLWKMYGLDKKTVELSGPDGGAIVVKGYATVNPDDWDD